MTDRERVLALLERRGPAGVTPVDFAAPHVADGAKPIMRVAARVLELRELGHRIVTKRAGPVARYVLERPAVARPAPELDDAIPGWLAAELDAGDASSGPEPPITYSDGSEQPSLFDEPEDATDPPPSRPSLYDPE